MANTNLKNESNLDVESLTTDNKASIKKGNKQQISLTITPNLLSKVDKLASKMGQSRAAVINMAIYNIVERANDL